MGYLENMKPKQTIKRMTDMLMTRLLTAIVNSMQSTCSTFLGLSYNREQTEQFNVRFIEKVLGTVFVWTSIVFIQSVTRKH